MTPGLTFFFCTLVAYLAAETGALAAGRSRRAAQALRGGAALLSALALWWPGHLLKAHGTLAATDARLHGLDWLPALALAAVAAVTGHFIRRRHLAGAAVGTVLTAAMAYGVALMLLPELLHLVDMGPGEVLPVLVLSAGLLGLHWRGRRPAPTRAVHAAAAIVVGGLMGASLGHAALHGPVADWPAEQSVPLVTLALLAALLVQALRHSAGAAPQAAAPQASVAAVDSLTGLPMRQFFEQRLAAAARRAQRRKEAIAVFFIDLDGFKPVNDGYGHACGDRVLQQVGIRLRAVAGPGDVVARCGGDEFLLLSTTVADKDDAARLAKKVIAALSRSYRFDEHEVTISCSIGIALHPAHGSVGKLITRADLAMYSAKRAGGSRHAVYAPEMENDGQHDFELLRDLRAALTREGELELYFQPKIDARSGKITAAEALLRWQHPTRGLLGPGQFIALAERSGLIGPLGDWVIEAACRQARAWRDKGLRMRVAINISVHQMRQDDIVERIAEALKRHRIHPSLLTLEITETAAMEDTRATQQTFRKLGELGVHLSIDDFGTGYSSLSYLRQLPAEELKIDRSFVQDLEHSADAVAVVDAVLKMAHALGKKVVAEGVENPRQQEILVGMGCDQLQGFLFARPMTARALLLWAMGDRSEAAVFRNSLFGETRQTTQLQVRLTRPYDPEADEGPKPMPRIDRAPA